MRELVAAAASGWTGEAEIVERYFAAHRTRAGDLRWLTAQTTKETQDFRELPPALQQEYLRTGRLAAHPQGPDAAARFAAEMRHVHLLAALVTELSGAPLDFTTLQPLPEDATLQALRHAHRAAGGALGNAVMDFCEGGGGAMYVALSRITGGPFERRVAAAFAAIYRDEIGHGPMLIHAIARVARGADDWQRAAAMVREVGAQRLLMRNEMFGHPLDAARLAEIRAGKIEPWPLPIAI